jgi:hypothetical protein
MRALPLLVLLGLCGCGGGGGDSGPPPLTLSLSPNPLQVSYYPAELPATVRINVTTAGETSATTLYVIVTDTGTGFAPGPATIFPTGDNTYVADLATRDLAYGVHSGTLNARVCADPSCTQVLTQATLPYSITAKAPGVYLVGSGPPVWGGIVDGTVRVHVATQGAEWNQAAWGRVVGDDNDVFEAGTIFPLEYVYQNLYMANLPLAAAVAATTYTGEITFQLCADAGCAVASDTYTREHGLQVFELLAGVPGQGGTTDGAGADARFLFPQGLALDSAGNVLVADSGNSLLRRITPEGVVSTLLSGASTGVAPQSVAVDASDNVYAGGAGGVVKRTPGGTVTTFSAFPATGGMTIDAGGDLWFANESGGTVREQAASGTILRTEDFGGSSAPRAILVAADGSALVSTATGLVTLAADGTKTPYSSVRAQGLALEPSGSLLVTQGSALSRLTDTYITQVAYEMYYPNGNVFYPWGLARASDGTVFVSDYASAVILRTTVLEPAAAP